MTLVNIGVGAPSRDILRDGGKVSCTLTGRDSTQVRGVGGEMTCSD